jgi:hypothetical protein
MTLSADGKILATAHLRTSREIDLLPGAGGGAPVSFPGLAKQAILGDVAGVRDAQLLVSLGNRLIRMAPDGTHQVTLLDDPASGLSSVAACGDARFVVFSWHGHGQGSDRNIVLTYAGSLLLRSAVVIKANEKTEIIWNLPRPDFKGDPEPGRVEEPSPVLTGATR